MFQNKDRDLLGIYQYGYDPHSACHCLLIEPDLGKWPPVRKKLNFISTTEQDLLFILSCVATMY